MSNLGPQQQNQSFSGLLQIPGGVTRELQQVQDGEGNPTGLWLSTGGSSAATSNTFVASEDGVAIPDAVVRRISDGFGDYISVKDFGAVGDGATDDTVAIQNAINSIIGVSGQTIFFPPGTYKITSAITITQGVGFVIKGARGSSVLKQATSNTPIFKFTSSDTHSFLIDGIQFTYSSAQAYANTNSNAIEFSGSATQFYNFTISECTFSNGRRAITATGTAVVWGYVIEKCVFGGTMSGASVAFPTSVGQPNVNIRNCYIAHNSNTNESDIILVSAETVLLENIEFNNGTYATGVLAMSLTSCQAIAVISCKIENAVWTGATLFGFVSCTSVNVIGCNFITISGTRTGTPAIILGNSGTSMSVVGCNFSLTGTTSFPAVASVFSLFSNSNYTGSITTDWVGYGLSTPVIQSNTGVTSYTRGIGLDNCFVKPYDALPLTAVTGQLAFKNADGKGYMYDGSTWQALW